MAVSRRLVRSQAAAIEVLAEGDGPGIVLLPSMGRSGDGFAVISGLLARAGFRVLRPEPRGIGASRGPMAGVTLHDLAADIACVIEDEGCGPAIVAGHAHGNFVARTIATDRPDLVRATILLAGRGRSRPRPELVDAELVGSDASQPRAARLAALGKVYFAPGSDPSPWLEGWHHETRDMQLASARLTPVAEFFHAGTAPILQVHAEHDAILTAAERNDLKAEFGDRVTVVTIADAGRALLPEQSHAVADAIVRYARWLDQADGASRSKKQS